MSQPVRLVTLAPAPCEWCGSEAAAGPCPWSIECPHCGSAPGIACRRPSGHRAAMHAERVARAEAVDALAYQLGQRPEQLSLFAAHDPRQEVLAV